MTLVGIFGRVDRLDVPCKTPRSQHPWIPQQAEPAGREVPLPVQSQVPGRYLSYYVSGWL